MAGRYCHIAEDPSSNFFDSDFGSGTVKSRNPIPNSRFVEIKLIAKKGFSYLYAIHRPILAINIFE